MRHTLYQEFDNLDSEHLAVNKKKAQKQPLLEALQKHQGECPEIKVLCATVSSMPEIVLEREAYCEQVEKWIFFQPHETLSSPKGSGARKAWSRTKHDMMLDSPRNSGKRVGERGPKDTRTEDELMAERMRKLGMSAQKSPTAGGAAAAGERPATHLPGATRLSLRLGDRPGG
jgi:hypothetical protein